MSARTTTDTCKALSKEPSQPMTNAIQHSLPRLGFLIGLLVMVCLAVGAAPAAADQKVTVFDATYTDESGNPVTAAGSHPHRVDTDIGIEPAEIGDIASREAIKDIIVELPPGLVGNPEAIPQCDIAAFVNSTIGESCAAETQVGHAQLWLGVFGGGVDTALNLGIANLGPANGTPAVLAINIVGVIIYSSASVRSGDDYGVNINTRNITKGTNLLGVTYKLWGNPQDPSHDGERGYFCLAFGFECLPSTAPNVPFISLPTSCGPMTTRAEATGWPTPDARGTASSIFHDNTMPVANPLSIDGCDEIDFTPSLDARPTTNVGDSASGLDVDLHTPQNEDPNGTAEAHLKDSTVKLPEGLVINPSSANGLGTCGLSEIGFEGSSNERQTIDLTGIGPFAVTFDGKTTSTIPGGSSPAVVEAALEALSNLGSGDVSVDGGNGSYEVEFTGARSGEDVPLMSVNGVTNKVLELSGSGSFTLSYEGDTTQSLEFTDFSGFDKLGYEFAFHFNKLPSVVAAGGGISVVGGEGADPYYVFLDGGSFAGTDQTIIATGGSVSLTDHTAAGAPISGEVATIAEVGGLKFTPGSASCPDASRLASAEIETPLVDHVLQGSVYLAEPFDNPFDELIALYITADDPQTGLFIKLAGRVELDPNTGQVTAVFDNNPQLPFEHLRLHFFGGSTGALRTPSVCGNHTTSSTLTPWSAPGSGPPVQDQDTWQITQNCANSEGELPNSPSLDAGTVSPIAGANSPFVVHLRREDGSQNFSAITVDPPPGLLAKLAGTAICSDAALGAASAKSGAAEQASPSCPANSRVGSVVAGAGAGPAPYHAPGTAYLAGPYKGAPLSLAIVVPAKAGPFDLGTVVTRVAAYIDSRTAQITAVSDPLPTILDGIPLDVRTVDVALDRPEFTRNPTSCNPLEVKGLLTSTLGQVASLENRFQVGECGRLGFRPRVFLRLFGKRFSRGANPRLRAVIVPRQGDANISRIAVKMPRSLYLDQSHIRTVCTRVQFAADACPPGSIYGKVNAQSPLVDYPLTGNVYLRSSNNKLPDLVADLRGPAHQPVRIEGVGRTDSVKGALRNTFDIVPDAPVSKIVLLLQPGRKSLLVASRNLCSGVQRARVNLSAHNGRQLLLQQKIRIPRCDRKRKRQAAKRRSQRRRNNRAALARGSAAG